MTRMDGGGQMATRIDYGQTREVSYFRVWKVAEADGTGQKAP